MKRIGLIDQGEIEKLELLTELEMQKLLTFLTEKAVQMDDIMSISVDGQDSIIFETAAGPVFYYVRKRTETGRPKKLSKCKGFIQYFSKSATVIKTPLTRPYSTNFLVNIVKR